MRAWGMLCLAMLALCASAKAQGLPDEQIVLYRVGSTFDPEEMAYFGLSSFQGERADSVQYGVRSGAFVLIPYTNGQSRQLILTPGAQREFLRYIAHYEEFVREPSKLDVKALGPVGIKLPLVRREKSGRFAEVVKDGRSYFGEIAFVEGNHLGLYSVDLGYEAELAPQEMRMLAIDSLTNVRIYKRSMGRYVGLTLGVVAAGSLAAFGTSITNFSEANANYAAGFLIYPAIGFGVGYLLDISLGFSSEYDMRLPEGKPVGDKYLKQVKRINKAKRKLAAKVMFPATLPPELQRALKARQH